MTTETKKSNVYTRTGDKGTTSLYCGDRKKKSDDIFNILGSFDELTSRIGMLCALTIDLQNILPVLRTIQQNIQNINSVLATFNPRKQQKLQKITIDDIKKLETDIDTIDSQNAPLTSFILPGLNMMDSQSHLCRTQTRTVERYIWKLYHEELEINPDIFQEDDLKNILTYTNRLSDFFFVLARYLCL